MSGSSDRNQTLLLDIDVVDECHLELTSVGDQDVLFRLSTVRAKSLHFLDDVQAINHSAKDDMLTVQPKYTAKTS